MAPTVAGAAYFRSNRGHVPVKFAASLVAAGLKNIDQSMTKSREEPT